MTTPVTKSFQAEATRQARVLILGSHPGQRSLAAAEYYAHPRNRFWPLMQELLGVNADAPYAERLRQLKECGIALWDVLGECVRPGSLDSSIERTSEYANPILEWLDEYPTIQAVAFNGQAAQNAFHRHFSKTQPDLRYIQLPSTSPANARWSMDALLDKWKDIAAELNRSSKSI